MRWSISCGPTFLRWKRHRYHGLFAAWCIFRRAGCSPCRAPAFLTRVATSSRAFRHLAHSRASDAHSEPAGRRLAYTLAAGQSYVWGWCVRGRGISRRLGILEAWVFLWTTHAPPTTTPLIFVATCHVSTPISIPVQLINLFISLFAEEARRRQGRVGVGQRSGGKVFLKFTLYPGIGRAIRLGSGESSTQFSVFQRYC